MNNKNSFINNFLVLFTSNVFQLLLGIVTSIIVARWLAPEGLGLKTVLANFPTLFVTFFEMGTRQSTIFFIGNKKYNESQLFPTINSLWLISSVLGLVVYGILSYFQFSDISAILIVVSASYIPIRIGHSFLTGILLGKQLVKKLAIFNTLNAFLTPLLTIVFLVVLDWGVFGVLLASQVAALYTLLVRVFLLRKEIGFKFSFKFNFMVVKDLFVHGFYYALALFLTTNFTIIPIFLMHNRISAREIGIYSAGAAFAMLLKQVVSSTFPILFAKGANAGDKRMFSLQVHKLLRVTIVVLFFLCILVYFCLEYILPLMYGDKYIDSVLITRIMLGGVYIYVLQYILIMDMAGKGKPQITIKAMLPSFLLCILFNYWGIDKFGNIGAAVSTSLAMFICGISYFIVYAKETHFSISFMLKPRKSDWIDVKKQIISLFRK